MSHTHRDGRRRKNNKEKGKNYKENESITQHVNINEWLDKYCDQSEAKSNFTLNGNSCDLTAV